MVTNLNDFVKRFKAEQKNIKFVVIIKNDLDMLKNCFIKYLMKDVNLIETNFKIHLKICVMKCS